jgi:hypothetical protein
MQGNAALPDMIGLGLRASSLRGCASIIVSVKKKKASPAPCSSLVRECAGNSELVSSSADGVQCRGRGKRIVVAIQSKQLRVDAKRFISGRRRRRHHVRSLIHVECLPVDCVVVMLRHVLGTSSSPIAVVFDGVCRMLRVEVWLRVKKVVFDAFGDLVAVLRSVSCCELLCERTGGLACLTGDRSQADCVRAALTH